MILKRAMVMTVGVAAGLGASGQGDPRPLEFERTEIQPASELIDLGVSPFYRFVTRDGSVVGVYAAPGGGFTTFLQRADGSGFESLGDFAPRGANSLGHVVGVVGNAGALGRPGDPLKIVQDPSVSSSRLLGISEMGLAVGQAVMGDDEHPQPIVFDRDGLRVLPVPDDTAGAAALGISPDGRTIVGTTVGESNLTSGERVLVWRDGVVRETAIRLPRFLSPYPSEVSDSGVLLLNGAYSIEPVAAEIHDLNTGEQLYQELFDGYLPTGDPRPTRAAGISQNDVIAFADSSQSVYPGSIGFVGPDGVMPFELRPETVSVVIRDWDITGTHLLTREWDGSTGSQLIYTRIPSPGVLAVLGTGALLAARRRL